jgi:hypothetical protein
MSNILDDLFQWAAQQPQGNSVTVQIAIATNEVSRNNLVSYAAGELTYFPAHSVGIRHLPPHFASEKDGLKQYFSDRGNAPFDHTQTDPLSITINGHFVFSGGNYSITVHSSKWNFTFTFETTSDPATQVLYGTDGSTFITVSLCGQNSQAPLK